MPTTSNGKKRQWGAITLPILFLLIYAAVQSISWPSKLILDIYELELKIKKP